MKSPSLIHTNFSLPQFSWNNEELPMKDFETLIQKNCDRKTWYPPASSKQDSRYQIFCETPRCSQCTFSVNADKNCLTELCITSPPSFSYFSSHNRKFLKRRRFPNEFLWYCDLRNFDGKTWYPLLSSITDFLAVRFSLKHWWVPKESFRYCEAGKIDRKTWFPASHP